MKLNMSILYDSLREQAVACHLSESLERPLVNIRLVGRSGFYSDQYVYLLRGTEIPPVLPKYFIAAGDPAAFPDTEEHAWICLEEGTAPLVVLERIQEVFEWFDRWEEQLMAARLRNAELPAVVECMAEAFPDPIALIDSSARCIAWAGEMPEKRDAFWDQMLRERFGYIPELNRLFLDRHIEDEMYSACRARIYRLNDPQWPDFLLANIFDPDSGTRLGNLCTTDLNAPLTYGQASVMQYAAEYICGLLKNYSQSVMDSRRQSFHHFLAGEQVDEASFRSQMTGSRQGDMGAMRILCFAEDSAEARFRASLLTELLHKAFSDWEALFLAEGDHVLGLVLGAGTEDEPRQLLQRLENVPALKTWRLGISDPFLHLQEMPFYRRQAEIAAAYASCGIVRGCRTFRQCRMAYIRQKLTEELPLTTICSAKLCRMQEYDAAKGTEYCRTLQRYLENQKNLSRTAEAMYLHRNTILYRLERIRDLFGEELLEGSVGELLFDLQLLNADQ